MMKTQLLHLLVGFVAAQGNSQLRRSLATEEGERISQNYLLDGLELNFLAEEVAGDFCDASSPLSLAGYMNGEFLYRSII